MQKLVDEEFQGIEHIRTSTLHKKVAAARHDFIKLSGAENKLEALLQVLIFFLQSCFFLKFELFSTNMLVSNSY